MRERESSRPRILFVCGRNRWRSPTAERLYRNDSRVAVRSAGVSEKSPHRISGADIAWADLILVMEERYADALREQFRRSALPPIKSLDIPDQYRFMDEELVELLRSGVEHHIGMLKKD
jgi:predicted protein tyrosine phosphatase